jgi:hypothetical protein
MKAVLTLLACLLLAPPVLAREELPEMKIHRQSGVTYITGGNTPQELKAMRKVSGHYWLQFSIGQGEEGAPVQAVRVVMRDIRGVALVEAEAEGPLFFMTPYQGGRYTLEFTHGGQTISHTMDLVGRRYVQMEIRFDRDPAAEKPADKP